MSNHPTNLETSLQALEREVDGAQKALGAALKEVKRAKAAAAVGQVREIAQALDNAAQLADQAAGTVGDVRDGWRFDVAGWFSSGEYVKELLATAADAGLDVFESDERLLCYPAVVQVSPADLSVSIDKRRDRRVRPSFVVRTLSALQGREPSSKPAAFIAALAAAYDLVVAGKGLRPGVPVKLVDVHGVLTLLPGSARDYTRQELARDLYLLDRSGLVTTKDGRRMTLPASATSRGGGQLTTVSQTGQPKVYITIAFIARPGTQG